MDVGAAAEERLGAGGGEDGVAERQVVERGGPEAGADEEGADVGPDDGTAVVGSGLVELDLRFNMVTRPRLLARIEALKAALDRLQSTSIATSIRQAGARRRRRFSWINEWRERLDDNGRALGIEMIVPDWLYEGVLDRALVLTIDPAYFALTGGLERWLYRIVRKHGGKQKGGWSFDISHLHVKSGALSPLKRFAFEVRAIVRRQSLPGYNLALEHQFGRERLLFVAAPVDPFASARRRMGRAWCARWSSARWSSSA